MIYVAYYKKIADQVLYRVDVECFNSLDDIEETQYYLITNEEEYNSFDPEEDDVRNFMDMDTYLQIQHSLEWHRKFEKIE